MCPGEGRYVYIMDGHGPGGSETEGRYAKGLEVGTLREHCVPVIGGDEGRLAVELRGLLYVSDTSVRFCGPSATNNNQILDSG